MKLIFDDLALADLEGIYNWIAKDNPKAAFAAKDNVAAALRHYHNFAI